jgi:hypothetical protein
MMTTKLQDVFGIATEINAASYVNRGGLDERLGYYLDTQRHVAIHGDSKQGKSWLRGRLLEAKDTIVVQCLVDSTAESIFEEALGAIDVRAELKSTGRGKIEGELDFSGGGQLGNVLLGKVQLEGGGSGGASKEKETETAPIGKTPGDLSWVARTLKASGKRLVIEDFHYVSEDNRKQFAFLLKALGDYGVNVIVVGVWPEDHLLTYYNGDLDGRVEDIRLVWEEAELKHVLDQGCEAMKIRFAPELSAELVGDAYGNVGLLQRLAEQVCMAAGAFTDDEADGMEIGINGELSTARAKVSSGMRARYDSFADNFVRGMKRMTQGLEVYKHLLRAFTGSKSDELLDGIDSRELLKRIQADGSEMRQSDLTQALDRIDRLQVKIGVRPQVLTYNRDRRRLFLADRSFLFYRKYGTPTWPWEKDDTLEAAIKSAPEGDQLDLDTEIPLSERAYEDLAIADDDATGDTAALAQPAPPA